MEVREHEVYTLKEAESLLKVSASTLRRMIRAGHLKGTRVGKQYRFLGKEILQVLTTDMERERDE
jgi:excisionase family DNA binding protein